jgi:hypothetical protein
MFRGEAPIAGASPTYCPAAWDSGFWVNVEAA